MIDVYSPGDSETHVLSTGATMATLSDAAYEDDAVARGQVVRRAHFDEVHFEARVVSDAQALVVRDHRAIVVAFRGTEENPRDVVLDGAVVTVPGVFHGAHAGFASAVTSLERPVTDVVRAQLAAHGPLEVWLTGHSLGGAMAQIYAVHLRSAGIPVAGVVTFGAPAPGKSEFSDYYGGLAERTHRFENHEDIVPCLPPDQVAWVQSGHVHAIYEDHVDTFSPSGSGCASVPSALVAQPLCDAPKGWRIAVGFALPGLTLSCELPEPSRALLDLLLDVFSGRGGGLHGIASYRSRLHTRLGRRALALVGG